MMKEMTRQPGYRAVARFVDLNLKNLLYYQLELARLKKLLAERETKDYAMFKARRGLTIARIPQLWFLLRSRHQKRLRTWSSHNGRPSCA
jgi:hypothetical protein